MFPWPLNLFWFFPCSPLTKPVAPENVFVTFPWSQKLLHCSLDFQKYLWSFPILVFLACLSIHSKKSPGADAGFFLGGRGVPLRNDVTDGEVKKIKSEYVYTKTKASSHGRGGGAPYTLPLDPPLKTVSICLYRLLRIRSCCISIIGFYHLNGISCLFERDNFIGILKHIKERKNITLIVQAL